MATEWFVEVNGKQYGPLTAARLKQLAENGKVKPTTRVRKGAAGSWVQAANVAELLTGARHGESDNQVPPSASVGDIMGWLAEPAGSHTEEPEALPTETANEAPRVPRNVRADTSPRRGTQIPLKASRPGSAGLFMAVAVVSLLLGASGLIFGLVVLTLRQGTPDQQAMPEPAAMPSSHSPKVASSETAQATDQAETSVPPEPKADPARKAVEQLFRRYFTVSTWQERLPLVASPEEVGPLMEKYYTRREPLGPVRYELTLPNESTPSDSLTGTVTLFNAFGVPMPRRYRIIRTPNGFRLDWIDFVGKRTLAADGILRFGRIVPTQDFPAIDAQVIEVSGGKYAGKTFTLLGCTFLKLAADDGGFSALKGGHAKMVFEQNGKIFSEAFIMDESATLDQAHTKRQGDLFNAVGTVREYSDWKGHYGIEIAFMEWWE